MNNQSNLKKPRNSKKLRSFGAICEGIHAKLARNPGTRNFVGFAAVAVLALVVWSFAADSETRKFSPKEEFTTTRAIVLMNTREVWDSYPPEQGVRKGDTVIEILHDVYDHENQKTNRKVMVQKGEYHRGEITFPAGSKIRILSSTDDGTSYMALMGPSKEVFQFSSDKFNKATSEPEEEETSGKKPRKKLYAQSRQEPKISSTVNWNGPEGIWSGIATGDENIPSSDPAWEKKFFDLVNHERTSRGIPALVWNEDMARAARYHAGYLYNQTANITDDRPVAPGVGGKEVDLGKEIDDRVEKLSTKDMDAIHKANPNSDPKNTPDNSPEEKQVRETNIKTYFQMRQNNYDKIAHAMGYASAGDYSTSYGGHNTMYYNSQEEVQMRYYFLEHWQTRVQRFNPLIKGENLAMKPKGWTPEKLLKLFMESPSNQANILSKQHQSTGVGLIQADAGMIIVQEFGL